MPQISNLVAWSLQKRGGKNKGTEGDVNVTEGKVR